jgi:uncharacterized protein YdbL (DUF1318 family)
MLLHSRVWLLLIMVCLISGCAIQTPEVRITGEKTALENQILGQYARLQEEVWMLVSYRALDSTSQTFSQERRQVLEAIRNRMFNRDDVEEFKQDGAVGEALSGLLVVRPTQKYEQDIGYHTRLDTVVSQENRDRSVIMVRIVELETNLDTKESDKVAEVFARLNQEGSAKGTWIEMSPGKWDRK